METTVRRLFEHASERAAHYREDADERAPRAADAPREAYARFDGPTPETGEDPLAIIDALADAAEPGLMDVSGRRFFGWVIGGSDEVGVAADFLTSAWGQNAGNVFCSPAAAAAETVAARWLLDILRLPHESAVGLVTGATMANFVGLAAGRQAVLERAGWDLEADGLQGAPPIRVFIGEEAHSTTFAALRYLGFGQRQIIRVETDGQGAMNAGALERALKAGEGPALIAAQAGQINTGAFDPVGDIVDVAAHAGAWVHVDGAFGLWARACPDRAALAEGVEKADSWATDGHKWLQAPYDCGIAIVRDAEACARTMSITASYLPADEALRDRSHFTPELSRRARGFAVWAILRRHGRAGIAEMVGRHCALARRIADRLRDEPGLAVLNDVVLNQVALGFGEDWPAAARDQAAADVAAEIQRRNVVFAETSGWRGRRILRVSVISGDLTEPDADRLADEVRRAWRAVRERGPAAAATPTDCMT
ncbi:MAG: pyridoxal-dependent decarboxylase [Maricaulaceae bacterium]|jgi:glutamate/tyrosine decarboxylase-like PLP-dependent enzyme